MRAAVAASRAAKAAKEAQEAHDASVAHTLRPVQALSLDAAERTSVVAHNGTAVRLSENPDADANPGILRAAASSDPLTDLGQGDSGDVENIPIPEFDAEPLPVVASPVLQDNDYSESENEDGSDSTAPPRRFLAKRRVQQLLRRDSEPVDYCAKSNWCKCGFDQMPKWTTVRWWAGPLRYALEPFVERNAAMGGLIYQPKRMYNCGSTLGELVGSRALGVPWDRAASVANEKKDKRREFIKLVHAGHVGHLFKSQAQFCTSNIIQGHCDIAQEMVFIQTEPGGFDVISGGTPCRPHSTFRGNKGSKKPDQHHEFDSLFGSATSPEGSYLATVEIHRPKGGYIEEVAGIAHKQNDEGMPENSYLEKAAERIAAVDTAPNSGIRLYTAIKVINVGPKAWLKLRRTRIVCVTFVVLLNFHFVLCSGNRICFEPDRKVLLFVSEALGGERGFMEIWEILVVTLLKNDHL